MLYNGFEGIAVFSNWWEPHAGGRSEDMFWSGGYNGEMWEQDLCQVSR